MARRAAALVGLLCVLIAAGSTVRAADPVVPEVGFAEGWERDGDRLVFVGHDLYGHINGGAELFHEFGFDSLIVQRYKHDGQELDLEIYLMTEYPSALGIYLMKVGKETPVDSVTGRNSGSASQLSLVRGRCFIQINNFYGEEALIPDMVALANATVASMPEDKPSDLWRLLPDSGLVEGSARLVRGQYAMQPIFTLGPGDMLLLDGRTFGVVGKYIAPDSSRWTRVVVRYANARFAQGVFRSIQKNLDPYLTRLEQWEGGLSFKDYAGKFGSIECREDILECRLNLTTEPQPPAVEEPEDSTGRPAPDSETGADAEPGQ